jgi:hypothetical protein
MCNLYSITTNQAAIIALFRVINRYVGNLPPMPVQERQRAQTKMEIRRPQFGRTAPRYEVTVLASAIRRNARETTMIGALNAKTDRTGPWLDAQPC